MKAVAYVYAAVFLYALGEGGSFPPETLKISFQLSGSDAFRQIYKIFCRAKRYSVAPLLTNLSTPAKQKEQASACSFCFTCEAVKERFELRATPPGGKTVLRTVFSDDRRYLQSIGLNFRIYFTNIKRKISPPRSQGTAFERAVPLFLP